MLASLQEKSSKRILVLANNDVGLYRFRKDLLATLLSAGHAVYISLPDGGFVPELVQIGCRFIDTPIDRRGMNPLHDGKLFRQYRAILGEIKPYWAEKIPISIDIPTFLRMSQLDLARALTENIVKNGYFQDIATGRNAAFMTGRSS